MASQYIPEPLSTHPVPPWALQNHSPTSQCLPVLARDPPVHPQCPQVLPGAPRHPYQCHLQPGSVLPVPPSAPQSPPDASQHCVKPPSTLYVDLSTAQYPPVCPQCFIAPAITSLHTPPTTTLCCLEHSSALPDRTGGSTGSLQIALGGSRKATGALKSTGGTGNVLGGSGGDWGAPGSYGATISRRVPGSP